MALTDKDFQSVADSLGVEVQAVKAVQLVETGGKGGFNPDATAKTLFEGHLFSKFTNHQYDSSYPTISYKVWTRQFYGKTWQEEQARLKLAVSLNESAALKSASWGMFQILGMNFESCGFTSVTEFAAVMSTDEAAQLQAFAEFVKTQNLVDALKACDWDKFAARYNGPDYKANQYAEKLAAAYKKFKQVEAV